MATNTKDTPALRDPEADATLALLDRALGLVAEADEATSRELRDRADAAILLARRRKLDDVQRRAAELKLRAEARLGEIAPPPMSKSDAGKLGNETRQHGQPVRAAISNADRKDIDRCRLVAGVKDHIGAYLDYVKAAGEDPSRAGLLKWVEAITKGARKAALAQESNPAPANKATIDTSGKVVPNAPPAMSGATTDPKAMAAGLKINNRPKEQPKKAAPAARRDVFVAAKWRAHVSLVQRARDAMNADRPERLAPEGAKDMREIYHRDLVKLLDEWLYAANEAIEMEPMLVEGYAKERAKAARVTA